MANPNVSFAKISATPTDEAWSQSHNAGSLFLVVSLTSMNEEQQKELPILGKKLIGDLQTEFFSLEEKTLETIEQAITSVIQDIPKEIPLSLALTFIKDNILYVFVKSGGKVILKRNEKTGTVLETDEASLKSASGYLTTGDIIMLQTKQFSSAVSEKTLATSLEYTLPSDIAETLSPHIHQGNEAAASAVIVSFQGVPQEEVEQDMEELVEKAQNPESTSVLEDLHKPLEDTPITQIRHEEREPREEFVGTEEFSNQNNPSFFATVIKQGASLLSALPLPKITLSHRHKLILTIAAILSLLLLISIYFATNSQSNKENLALFDEAFASAQKDYDEGMSLLSLNKALAREDFQRAKDTIVKAKKELPDSSEEEKKLIELETKVDEKLTDTQNARTVTVTEIQKNDAPLLALFIDKKAQAVTEDTDNWYYVTDKTIVSVNKQTDKEETLVENDDDWEKASSLAVFSRNLYVLDPSKGIIKFVPTTDGYTATSYFTKDAPDLKNAVSMAIDASVWILFKDGTVNKYTRGVKDSFSLSGVPSQISSPFALITSPELDKLYILDKGTSSILKISKDGTFEEGYQTERLKNATAFTLLDDETKALILSGGKLYEMTL